MMGLNTLSSSKLVLSDISDCDQMDHGHGNSINIVTKNNHKRTVQGQICVVKITLACTGCDSGGQQH